MDVLCLTTTFKGSSLFILCWDFVLALRKGRRSLIPCPRRTSIRERRLRWLFWNNIAGWEWQNQSPSPGVSLRWMWCWSFYGQSFWQTNVASHFDRQMLSDLLFEQTKRQVIVYWLIQIWANIKKKYLKDPEKSPWTLLQTRVRLSNKSVNLSELQLFPSKKWGKTHFTEL